MYKYCRTKHIWKVGIFWFPRISSLQALVIKQLPSALKNETKRGRIDLFKFLLDWANTAPAMQLFKLVVFTAYQIRRIHIIFTVPASGRFGQYDICLSSMNTAVHFYFICTPFKRYNLDKNINIFSFSVPCLVPYLDICYAQMRLYILRASVHHSQRNALA